jgi:hypothetical protein
LLRCNLQRKASTKSATKTSKRSSGFKICEVL